MLALLLLGEIGFGADGPPAAAPPPWYTLPVIQGLHPVRPQPGLAWQRATAAAMAGPGASPYFRDTATELDVRWRLEAAGEPLLPADDQLADTALKLSLTGASMGLTRLVHDALARDEVLGVAQDVVRAAVSPGVVVQRRPEGFHVELDDRSRAFVAGRAAVLEGARRPMHRPPVPTLRVGTGLRLTERATDLSGDLVATPVPAVAGWFGLDHMGLDALLLDATWIEPWSDEGPPRLRWGLAARESLLGGLSLRAQLTSDDGVGLPDSGRLGLGYALNRPETWTVRLEGGCRLPAHTGDDPGEWRVEIGVRANLDWRLPVDIDRWPLGQQVGAPGPTLPSVRAGGPNRAAPLNPRPIDEPAAP